MRTATRRYRLVYLFAVLIEVIQRELPVWIIGIDATPEHPDTFALIKIESVTFQKIVAPVNLALELKLVQRGIIQINGAYTAVKINRIAFAHMFTNIGEC